MSLTGDSATDAMVPPALSLVWAVRENNGERITDCFYEAAQHVDGDMYRAAAGLAVTLAAMVPDDRTAGELLRWTGAVREQYLALRAEGLSCDEAATRATPGPRPIPVPARPTPRPEGPGSPARVVPIRRGPVTR